MNIVHPPYDRAHRETWIRQLRPLQRFCGERLATLQLRELSDQELTDAYNAITSEAYRTAIKTLSSLRALVNCPNAVGVRPESMVELAEIAEEVEQHYVRVLQLLAENTLAHLGLRGLTVERMAEETGLKPERIKQLLSEVEATRGTLQ